MGFTRGMPTLLVCTILSIHCLAECMSEREADGGESRRQVLVFGGNGFMGSATVVRLLEDDRNVITISNRGNTYWDFQERIGERVNRVECDRERPLESCPQLVEYVKSLEGGHLHMVIDFSAYNGAVVTKALELLQGTQVDQYVLISTDSVYEVCVTPEHGGPSRESDSVRPTDKADRDWLNNNDGYGNRKLQAEEAMMDQSEIPYVILRLPDVIGPRDVTYRWWIYQLWMVLEGALSKESSRGKVTWPTFLDNHQMSLVYSEDVADLIVSMFTLDKALLNKQIYNLAWEQTVTLKELLERMAMELDLMDAVDIVGDTGNNFYLYPSVKRGPMNVTRAETLAWTPSSWHQAFSETLNFYQEAMSDPRFITQRDEIIQIVTTHFYAERKLEAYEALETIFKIDLESWNQTRDEL